MRKRYDYKWGQYMRNVGDTGASRVGNVGFVLSVLLGIGLACFLALGPLVLGWPGRWAIAVMTAALLTGAGMCWVGKRSDWSFLLFFEAFSWTMLLFWSIFLRLFVTERVIFRNTWHLKAISAGLGIWAAIKHFRREKKYRDMGRASVSLAVILGILCFGICHSALLEVNVLADVREARQTTAPVIRVERESRTIYGRVAHDYTVYFAVVGENDLTETRRFPISKMDYDSLEPGDEVRLILHPGALGAPWLECVPNVD